MKYNYFLAGRTRDRHNLQAILASIRQTGKTVSCFIENQYESDGIVFDPASSDAEAEMQAFESVEDWESNPTFRIMFEADMQALKDSEIFILAFPAGLSAHMELGAAYGLGKKCYGIGDPSKVESLYLMFDQIYPTVDAFLDAQVRQHA